MSRNIKVLLVFVAILALAGAAYGFAAANTVPTTAAGYTAKVVSGYTVSNIQYNLTSGDPTTVDTITFGIAPTTDGDPAPVTVYLQTALSGPWTTCVVTTTTSSTVVCTPTISPTVAGVTALNIVASSTVDGNAP
ncbi:MAG: hypothetical protein WCE68_07635 [Anaerolineales bacterium]